MNIPTLDRIARSLGGKVISGRVRAPGPGHSRNDDSLAVWPAADRPSGVAFVSFAGDAPGDVIRMLKEAKVWLTDQQPTPRPTPKPVRRANLDLNDPHDQGRRREAQRLWAQSVPATGTLAQVYLKSRGYLGPTPATVRFVPGGRLGPHPILIAAAGAVKQGEEGELHISDADVTACIRIFLSSDGRSKAAIERPKLALGPMSLQPIWLRPIGDGLNLSVAEGIEDALSPGWPLGIGAWACGGAGFLEHAAHRIPPYVEAVILAEDDNDAGRRGCDKAEAVIAARKDWLANKRPPSVRRIRTWEGGGA